MAPVPNLVQEENLRMHLCGPDIVSVQVLPHNVELTTCGIKKLEKSSSSQATGCLAQITLHHLPVATSIRRNVFQQRL